MSSMSAFAQTSYFMFDLMSDKKDGSDPIECNAKLVWISDTRKLFIYADDFDSTPYITVKYTSAKIKTNESITWRGISNSGEKVIVYYYYFNGNRFVSISRPNKNGVIFRVRKD